MSWLSYPVAKLINIQINRMIYKVFTLNGNPAHAESGPQA
jgi:hypothetical protein